MPPSRTAAAPAGGSPAPSAARRVALRLAALLLGVVAALLLAEVLLRALRISPPRLVTKRWLSDPRDPLLKYQCYASNPHGELGPLPDLRGRSFRLYDLMMPPQEMPLARLRETPYCVAYRYAQAPSGHRLRGAPPPARPRPGAVRILGIGDSFAFGEGVPEERTLFVQLQGLLGGGYDVINGGKRSAYLREEVKLLGDLARDYHADRAIVVFIANDVTLTPELAARQEFINDLINIRDQKLERHAASAWYTGHLRLLGYIGAHLDMARIRDATVRWYLDSYEPAQNGENLRALARDLAALASVPGRQVVLVLYPLLEGLERAYPLQAIHDRVAAMARAAGLPVLDLAPAFRGRRTADLWVHPTDHHPNGQAHGIAARAIAEWLRRDVPAFLLPPAAPLSAGGELRDGAASPAPPR